MGLSERAFAMTQIASFDAIDPCVLAVLEARLRENACAKNAPPYRDRPLSVLAHDDDGALIGGLTGKTFWNWLYIDVLWVDEKRRGQGLGGQLVHKAEAIAAARGCTAAYLWTESFEAPDFYQKLGYRRFVVKDDFPAGFQRIGFLKPLSSGG